MLRYILWQLDLHDVFGFYSVALHCMPVTHHRCFRHLSLWLFADFSHAFCCCCCCWTIIVDGVLNVTTPNVNWCQHKCVTLLFWTRNAKYIAHCKWLESKLSVMDTNRNHFCHGFFALSATGDRIQADRAFQRFFIWCPLFMWIEFIHTVYLKYFFFLLGWCWSCKAYARIYLSVYIHIYVYIYICFFFRSFWGGDGNEWAGIICQDNFRVIRFPNSISNFA